MTGAPRPATGKSRDRQGRGRTLSRPTHARRLLRAIAIYLVFAAVLVGTAYVTARNALDDRERREVEVALRKAEEKRQGRVVYAQTDGHCRMSRFDNASARMEGSVTLPCDTPAKDPLTAARDFSWGNK